MKNYSKGIWELKELKSGLGFLIICKQENVAKTSEGTIDNVQDLIKITNNANLIVTAVNACQQINPDDPLTAAESITGTHKALKAYTQLQYTKTKEGDCAIISLNALNRVSKLINEAIDKAEGK